MYREDSLRWLLRFLKNKSTRDVSEEEKAFRANHVTRQTANVLPTACGGMGKAYTPCEAAPGGHSHYRLIGTVRAIQQRSRTDWILDCHLPERVQLGRKSAGCFPRITAPSGGLKVYVRCDSRLLQPDKTGQRGRAWYA